GWTGGAYGVGARIKLKYTRAIIDAINSGALDQVETITDAEFGFEIPTSCPGVPAELLLPKNTWADKAGYDQVKAKLVQLFQENFKQFEASVNAEIVEAGPTVSDRVA
ncbi:MAG: phosphoenolpyruvate carboxykinase (ATP), partial [Phaeodactylibacter sp.]|nr:phosphoenolpyruvate carboxykinase (ATP) [Phaeodactylibacter sp.]